MGLNLSAETCKMKPNKEGIWEWFKEDGTKCLVAVYNVMANCPNAKPYWRVYFWGGYYNIYNETNPCDPEGNNCTKEEWPDRWGNYVGPINSVPDGQLYLMPAPKQAAEIKKQYEN